MIERQRDSEARELDKGRRNSMAQEERTGKKKRKEKER